MLWFRSIASLYVRAQDAGRVWNRALVVANPSENGLVAVQASYTNTADASSYTTDYILETSEKDSASQKDSSAKSAESAKSSADQSTASTDAAAQKTSTAKTSALADSADDTSSQKESEAKLAQDKSDEQAKTAESQKAKDLDDHTQNVKSADADKVDTQDSQKSEKSEHTVDSEKKSSEAQDKAQEVSAKAKADTAKSDSATAESTKSSSSALAAGTLGAAGVTAAGIAASSKSDREDSRYEYDYDADPQNVTGRHDAQAAEQSKTETDSDKSEKSSVSGASAAKDSSDLSTPEAEAEKTKVEKSSEDEEELNSMQAALATIVASSEAKKTASNAKEDAADTSAAVKTSGTDSKSAADKTSEDSQKAAGSESTVKAESDAKTTAGYTSENQSANVTQAVVEESQAGTTSTDSSSALPKHVDDLALVPEVEKDSLTGSTDTKPQEPASNKQDALAGQSATAVAVQSETSTADGKTAQHESADLPPAEAEPDTPAHQAHSSVLAGDALAEGNLVLTDAKVIEHLAPVTEALFGENGSAKDATTVLIRVRSVGSYYDVLTHVRRNGFWEQVRTFELVSEEDLGIPTLKADSYSGEDNKLSIAYYLGSPSVYRPAAGASLVRLLDLESGRVWSATDGSGTDNNGYLEITPGEKATSHLSFGKVDTDTVTVMVPMAGFTTVSVLEADTAKKAKVNLSTAQTAIDQSSHAATELADPVAIERYTRALDDSTSTHTGDKDVTVTLASDVTFASDSAALTPAADNDSLSMAYTDNNGIARTLSAAKENGEWRITAAGTSASIDPASGTITLPPERILDNSTVRASGGQNGTQSAETTLRSDADNPPLEAYLFAASDAPVNEGDSAHYLIRLNRPAERDLTFNVRVSHKDTDAGDLDDSTQTVTIRAGESHATFRIDTRDDTNAEHIETYKVSITSSDGGATVPDWKASLTGEIRDNDGTIAAPNVHEGADGTTITPAAGAQHIHITYQDNQFGNVTLNAWRDDNNRWHLSEVNPDKRTTAPSIDPDSGSVTLPSSILAAAGRVHAHNNDSQNSGAGGRNSAVAEYDGWKLDWHDTFDKSVEESGWTRYGWGWQTPEHGGMGRYQQSNAYTADGVLNIQNQYHNGAWTSVGISSGDTFAASGGRWEIRAKFSDAKGIGYAFLLWPKSENWPPEVDFAEGRVRDPNIMGTYHWGTAADHQQDNQFLRNADLTDWHTYGAIIDPDAGTITYTFDGKPWYTLKNVPVTSEMMWLGMQTGSQDPNGSAAQSESIDNAIPGAHTPAASNIQIDWAAHYRKDDSAPPQPQQNHEGSISITGEAKVGSTLTATVTDGDGFVADNVQYQWLRDGQPIDQANGSTYTLSKDDAGHKITVQATYKDNAGHDETPTSETTDIPTPPANQDGTITISGEAKVGSELTAHIHDQDGVPSSGVQYQWFANDQAIPGATGSRYTLTVAEKGKTITVQASYTDNADHSEQIQSEATVAVKDRIVLDVTDAAFGATANDQTDDTAAIQKAIDTAGNAGGGTVVIPSGTYLINAVAHKTSWGSGSSGLLMRDNVTVQMQPDTVLQAMTSALTRCARRNATICAL